MRARRARLRRSASTLFAALAAVVWIGGCATAPGAPERPAMLGELERSAVEATLPEWVEAREEAEIDAAAARALGEFAGDTTVSVFLGTWCGDSRREISRLWRVLDKNASSFNFPIRFVGVDRAKAEPRELTQGRNIRYVPTIIVERDGEELGRIVESAPNGIESDLLALLTGATSGVVTGRDDTAGLGPEDGDDGAGESGADSDVWEPQPWEATEEDS